jgi:hypothetical protein
MTDSPKSFTKIVINGQEVGPERIPEFLRQLVQDADQNGVPDFLDQMLKNPLFKMVLGKSGERLKTELQNMKNLTPEQQKKIQTLMEKLGGLTGEGPAANTIHPPATPSSFRPSSPSPAIDYRSLGIPDPEQKRSSLPLIALLLLGAAIAAAAWVLMKS